MAIPIVPKRIGEIEIQIESILIMTLDGASLNTEGDATRRKLLVVVGEILKFRSAYTTL